jgi:protein TonB
MAARVLERKPGIYPAWARDKGVEGAVVLSIEILRDGRVGQVLVKESSRAVVLDEAARAAVRKWRFQPATDAGTTIASWAVVTYRFSLVDK